MRSAYLFAAPLLLAAAAATAQPRSAPLASPQCSDDYVTIEQVSGTIVAIRPAPDPFRSADIYFAGPERCARIWMQVLKKDVAQCQVGDRVEAKGIITSDPESDAWQVNPEKNDYMLLGEDFTCRR